MQIHRRTVLIEQFSSFLGLPDSSASTLLVWHQDSRLQRCCSKLFPTTSNRPVASQSDLTEALAGQLLQAIRAEVGEESAPLTVTTQLLLAYLQEPCFWATRQAYPKLRQFQALEPEATYQADWWSYFEIANDIATQPQLFLKLFQPTQGATLKTYAQKRLQYRLIDRVYAKHGMRCRSDWGLLKRSSPTRLQRALAQHQALPPAICQSYLRAHQVFQEIYATVQTRSGQALPAPTPAQWEQMTAQYNSRQAQLHIPQAATVPDLKAWLLTGIAALRADMAAPTQISLDSGDNSLNPETLATPASEPDASLVKPAFQSTMETAIAQLTPQERALLALWYGLGLGQKTITDWLVASYPNYAPRQYTVSRRLTKIRRQLLRAICASQAIEFTQAVLERAGNVLDEWLANHYRTCLADLLHAEYRSRLNSNRSQRSLGEAWLEVIAQQFQFQPPPSAADAPPVTEFLETWLASGLPNAELLPTLASSPASPASLT